jgi:hypothetical protein
MQGLPVDLVAGGNDGIVAEANVQAHYEAMRSAGVQVGPGGEVAGHPSESFVGRACSSARVHHGPA